MLGTVVVGVIFTDIKGVPCGARSASGRTLGKVEYVHGGVSRNVVENIAVSGMPVTFVSMTEAGGMGREAVERLNRCGVNTEFVLPVAEQGIGKWVAVYDENGEVAGQISCPPDMKPLADFVEAYGSDFVRDASSVILELDLGAKTAEHILSLAEAYGKKVYAVVGDMNVLLEHRELICRTDCLICNEAEISKLLEVDFSAFEACELQELLRREVQAQAFPSTVVTLGARGCVFYDRTADSVGYIPAIETAVVDLSGAGDAFLAGVVMGLSMGLSLERASALGTELGALTVGVRGGTCPPNLVPSTFLNR